MIRSFLIISLLVLLSGAVKISRIINLPAQDSLFNQDSCLHLTLTTDLTTILRYMDSDSLWHEGMLTYKDKNGEKKVLDIEVRVRGRFRRSSENCDFPPLEIKFNSTRIKNTIFQNQSKLKLVTHCMSKRNLYEQYLLQEYLIYKMYNLFTELSFKVRLASITYIDIQQKISSITKYAFFIESISHLANRNNGERLRVKYIHPDNTDSAHINMLSVYQYLIGNTDWSVPGLHNIVMMRRKPSGPFFAVPFDFEWSGIINAFYAQPQPMLGLHSVRERLFRGYCRNSNQFENTFIIFRQNHEKIYSLYNGLDALEEKHLKKALKYIDEFYRIIDNPKSVKKEFLDNCRTK